MFFNRRGISEMVGYALLIATALSLSLLVYAWLKSYVPGPVESCPDDVALVLADVVCDPTRKVVNLTLQNKGLFTVHGFYLKASNSSGIPIWILKNATNSEDLDVVRTGDFKPNERQRWSFSYAHINRITRIEIEPFVGNDENEDLLCTKAAITEEVNCG